MRPVAREVDGEPLQLTGYRIEAVQGGYAHRAGPLVESLARDDVLDVLRLQRDAEGAEAAADVGLDCERFGGIFEGRSGRDVVVDAILEAVHAVFDLEDLGPDALVGLDRGIHFVLDPDELLECPFCRCLRFGYFFLALGPDGGHQRRSEEKHAGDEQEQAAKCVTGLHGRKAIRVSGQSESSATPQR